MSAAEGTKRARRDAHHGQRLDVPYLTHHPVFTSAAEAVTALRDGWRRLRGTLPADARIQRAPRA